MINYYRHFRGTTAKIFRYWKPELFIVPMFEFVKEQYGNRLLIGCEIGVNLGHGARAILEYLNIKKLYLIDPYKPYTEGRYQYDYTKNYNAAKTTLHKHKEKIQFIKEESSKAYNKITDNTLDFIYIDGNHSYKYVRDDIRLYFDKVKTGGIFGGDNYHATYHDGVVKAVNEFIRMTGYELYGKSLNWWVIK